MTPKPRAPRVAELAADEGYNLSGAPVLLAKLTAYVGRATFAQLAAIATAAGGEYSRHNTAFQFPIDKPEARESFAAQARVILTNPQPAAPEAARTATQARAQSHRAARAAQATAEARDTWTVIPGPTPAEMDRKAAREERYRAEARRQYFEETRGPGPLNPYNPPDYGPTQAPLF